MIDVAAYLQPIKCNSTGRKRSIIFQVIESVWVAHRCEGANILFASEIGIIQTHRLIPLHGDFICFIAFLLFFFFNKLDN